MGDWADEFRLPYGASPAGGGGPVLLARYLIDAGSPTVPVPAGAQKVSIRARGAGGGGGGGGSGPGGDGGGGGAVAGSDNLPLNGAKTVSVSIGIAGVTPAYNTSNVNGTNGGATTVTLNGTVVVSAAGGSGGQSVNGNGTVNSLGGLAANCIGQFAYSGGRGGSYPSSGVFAADGANNPGSAGAASAINNTSEGGGGGGAAADLGLTAILPKGGRGGSAQYNQNASGTGSGAAGATASGSGSGLSATGGFAVLEFYA